MSRKSVPRHKACRRLSLSVCGAVNCPLGRRPNPPGQHGAGRKNKPSQYALQLRETQKLRAYYNVSAKQMLRYYDEASASKAQTNVAMVQKLETRLDSMVYRLGFAASLRASRQMVGHGHILLNGKKVNKPAIQIKPGDQIKLREKSQKVDRYKEWWGFYDHNLPYIQKNKGDFSGTLVAQPERDAIPIVVEDQLVVEFMAR